MPITDKRPLKVFLSYASQDKPLVRELSRRLVGEGWIDTWQDEKNLLPGQDWRVKIEEAVEDADVVIIVLSQHSVTKEGHVQKELRYAREIALEKPEDAIFLIPLRLDECEVPRGLRFYQWVDYFGDNKDSSYKALVASLNLRYKQKIKAEEAESLRKELQEREIAEKIAREKAEKDAVEKARLKAEEEERQRIAKEKAEHEAAIKVIREKTEKDAVEKARLEAEELSRQKTAKDKVTREKGEKEAAENSAREKTKREQREKELSEKQPRDASEKSKRETEKKENTLVNVKTKTESKITYWAGGFVVLILGIGFLSSLNNPPSTPQPTPENTQPNITFTSTYVKTAEPIITSTQRPTNTVTPATLGIETSNESIASSINSENLYFVSGDKSFNVLNTLTGKSQVLFPLEEFNDYLDNTEYSTISWLGGSNLFVWLGKEALVINLQSKQKRTVQTIFNYGDGFDTTIISSDLDENGYFTLHNINYWEMPFVLSASINGASDETIIASEREVWMYGYRQLFCMRQRPNDKVKVAVIVSELEGTVVGDPNLALLEVADTNASPIIIKRQVDGCISWSPDGRYIAYGNGKARWSGRKDFPKGIYYIDYVTGSVVEASDSDGYYPMWSPDGTSIAFITDQGISIVDVSTKIEKQIYSGDVLALLWGE